LKKFMLGRQPRRRGLSPQTRQSNLCNRVHEKPDPRKVLEFEELRARLAISLGVENLHQREVTVRHGRVPAPQKAGRPESTATAGSVA